MSPSPALLLPCWGGLSWGLGFLCGQVRGQPRPPPIHKACGSTWGAPRAQPEGSRLERRRAVLTGPQTAGWAAEQGPGLPDGEFQELGCLCSWAWDAGRPSREARLAGAPQGRPSPLSPAPISHGCHRSVPGPRRRPRIPDRRRGSQGPALASQARPRPRGQPGPAPAWQARRPPGRPSRLLPLPHAGWGVSLPRLRSQPRRLLAGDRSVSLTLSVFSSASAWALVSAA